MKKISPEKMVAIMKMRDGRAEIVHNSKKDYNRKDNKVQVNHCMICKSILDDFETDICGDCIDDATEQNEESDDSNN